MRQPNVKQLEKQCEEFNSNFPVGSAVLLKKDFVDEPVETEVTRPAFVMSGHSAVAFFKGISGCYHISCVKGPVV